MPQVEAWKKVLVSADFANTTHGTVGCRTCHGGRDGVNEMSAAHEGLVVDPSDGDAPACRACHTDIADKVAASLHGTLNGYHTAFAARGGIASEFQPMFSARCNSCHGTCGQCHISRPASVRGGLQDGHHFRKTPSQTDNCTACHGSRVGDEFRGRNAGIPEDVHYLRGMNCMSCHSDVELHGDGTTPTNRYANHAGPRCESCHPDVTSGSAAPSWHNPHVDKVACQVCHSVSYKNCYSCHVEMDKQGLRFPSEMDFRIGRNPIQSDDHPYDYVVLRHVPIAPDTFAPWGLELPDYAASPTWRYASPHNIQKNTPQTESCDNCHGGLDLFLSTAHVQALIQRGLMIEAEVDANRELIVDEIPDMRP